MESTGCTVRTSKCLLKQLDYSLSISTSARRFGLLSNRLSRHKNLELIIELLSVRIFGSSGEGKERKVKHESSNLIMVTGPSGV